MYCPVCRAEYRQGIAVCADCHVALVPSLPEASHDKGGAFVTLWEGDDLGLYTNLTKALDDAGIRYYERSQRDYTRKESLFWLEGASPIMFCLSVMQPDLQPSRRILEELLDREPEDVELPAADSEADRPADTIQERSAGEWNPAQATVEVWSGDDAALAQALEDCLRENDIGVRRAGGEAGTLRLFVMAGEEGRAREIIREVREGTPPD
jgi:hypothetical protein